VAQFKYNNVEIVHIISVYKVDIWICGCWYAMLWFWYEYTV